MEKDMDTHHPSHDSSTPDATWWTPAGREVITARFVYSGHTRAFAAVQGHTTIKRELPLSALDATHLPHGG